MTSHKIGAANDKERKAGGILLTTPLFDQAKISANENTSKNDDSGKKEFYISSLFSFSFNQQQSALTLPSALCIAIGRA